MDVYSAARVSSLGMSLPDDDPTVVTLVSIDEMNENESDSESESEPSDELGSELKSELLEDPPEVEFASVHSRRVKGPRPFLRLVRSSESKEEPPHIST